jgi:hypothetical protein
MYLVAAVTTLHSVADCASLAVWKVAAVFYVVYACQVMVTRCDHDSHPGLRVCVVVLCRLRLVNLSQRMLQVCTACAPWVETRLEQEGRLQLGVLLPGRAGAEVQSTAGSEGLVMHVYAVSERTEATLGRAHLVRGPPESCTRNCRSAALHP